MGGRWHGELVPVSDVHLCRGGDSDEIRIEQLDELTRLVRSLSIHLAAESGMGETYLLVQHSNFHPRIPPILFQDTAQRPSLQFSITPHHGTGPMSSHVAAYQCRESLRLEQISE